jgi:hypothetical protein
MGYTEQRSTNKQSIQSLLKKSKTFIEKWQWSCIGRLRHVQTDPFNTHTDTERERERDAYTLLDGSQIIIVVPRTS